MLHNQCFHARVKFAVPLMDKPNVFMVRQRLSCLATMTGGVKVRPLSLRALYQLRSMVVVAPCSGAVLPSVVLIDCTVAGLTKEEDYL